MTKLLDDPKISSIYNKIMDLNELVWGNRLDGVLIEQWLKNFKKRSEKIFALDILSKFTFYNEKEVQALLKSAFHLLKNHICLELIRQRNYADSPEKIIQNDCYFIGTWENPSKSGVSLLYEFRTLNKIRRNNFVSSVQEVPNDAKYVVFLDDITGSGRQAKGYWNTLVVTNANPSLKASFLYSVLVGTTKGISYIETTTKIKVLPTIILDERYSMFSKNSIYYSDDVIKNNVKLMCMNYGKEHQEPPLGYDNLQLLIGFNHNIPDNTIPIIWAKKNWNPIFPRYEDES